MHPHQGYGQLAPPPVALGTGSTAPLSSPFGTASTGGVRSSPFGALGSALPSSAPPLTAFHGGSGLAPPPSMADMAAMKQSTPEPTVASSPLLAAGVTPTTGGPPAPSPSFYSAGGYTSGSALIPPGHQKPDADLANLMKDLDQINSPKEFVRASVSRLPNSVSSKQKTPVPLGIVLQPLAPVAAGVVPDANAGSYKTGGIIRCRECRTYMNPLIGFEANGRRWTCNMCGLSQVTPDAYYATLDQNGKRHDRYERAELCKGAVEYIAPGEYMVRPPQPPVFLFVIDVSYSAVSTGMLHAVIDSIKDAIQQQLLPGGQRLQVGIITYDTSLHFYNLSPNLATPQMLVVADLDDLFLPLPDDILVNANESETAIVTLLDSLPTMFQDTKISESCMGSAVKGAFMAMKHIGGKLLVFGACIPSVGENALKSTRDQPRLLGTEKEVELLRPASDAYKDLAHELTRAQISAEIFVGANAYVDLASIAPLAKWTGGAIRYYPAFHIQTHGMKLKSEILHVLSREMGWEAVMRIRVSRGWKISKFYGHLFIRGQDLLVVPNCHTDQTFAITIEMDENVAPEPIFCLQSALLYTNSDGERRIRVHTYAAPTTSSQHDILNSVDVQASSVLLSSIALDMSMKSMSEGRNWLNNQCQQIVQASNMVHSEILQFLPLYIMGMLKSVAFRGTSDVSTDSRTNTWMRLDSLSVSQVAAFYYPRMMSLHNLPEHCGMQDETGNTVLPDMLNLTKDSLTQDGIYLLEDGEVILIWIGRAADPNTLQAVFGNGSIDQLDTSAAEATIGTSGDPLSIKIAAILRQVRAERHVPYLQLHILKGGDGQSELRFFNSLIEDKTMGLQLTYMEFLQRLGYRPPQQTSQAPPQMRR